MIIQLGDIPPTTMAASKGTVGNFVSGLQTQPIAEIVTAIGYPVNMINSFVPTNMLMPAFIAEAILGVWFFGKKGWSNMLVGTLLAGPILVEAYRRSTIQ